MKKRTKNAFLLILSVLTSLLVFCGCKLNKTRDEYLAEYGLTASVTYYTDKVAFGNEGYVTRIDYKSQQVALNIGVVAGSGSTSVKFKDSNEYRFDGWYYIELDADGQPVFEDEDKKQYKLTDKKFDFSKKLQDGENFYVGAKWGKAVVVRVEVLFEDGKTIDGKIGDEAVSLKNGDTIAEVLFPTTGKIYTGDIKVANKFAYDENSFTFVNYYMDKEATQKVVSIPQGEDDVVVYARYLTGKWTLVSNAANVMNMFGNLKNEKYWIVEDIDCKNTSLTPADNMNCEIASDGKTISNLVFKKTALTAGSTVAMFGEIGPNAKISNVNFENVSLQCGLKFNASIYVYLVCTSIDTGASVQNVHISGSIKISNGTLASEENNVAYGKNCGYDTDEAYEAANPNGFTTSVIVE